MENTNQDAMLNEQSQTYRPDTGGPMQIPDQGEMGNEEYNPSDLVGDVNAPASTPIDSTAPGDGISVGNNDGTEPDPEYNDGNSPLTK
ncbi:hypothetical protein DYU11_08585 [Fibrisoma montanum]|uniref:Uncharacterized protein n=1 Tax=Fibrisoma montanum TaxID=2305895 RepID=A0A418MEW4_9BACT|nr:hypothetical protein [Fibrisoma montanum]RIV25350.1 hypothetical protein DYU11_08585 [Fibrisoma montanum]